MSLESKTTKEICALVNRWYDDGPLESNFMDRRWVRIEEVKQVIKTHEDNLDTVLATLKLATDKIEAANQILNGKIEQANASINQFPIGSTSRAYMETETRIDLLLQLKAIFSGKEMSKP